QICIARSCDRPAEDTSPYSGFAFCRQHLATEIQRLEKRQQELLDKLDKLSNCSERQAMRLGQQVLIVEMQEITDMFEAVHNRLHQWKDRLVSHVQKIHDNIATTLKDVDEADACKQELMQARDSGQLRKVMELVVSMESFADDAMDRLPEHEELRAELKQDAPNRIIGDVSVGVQQLQFKIDRHFTDLTQHCKLKDMPSDDSPQCNVCKFDSTVSELPSGPRYITLCQNTKNYAANHTGVIIPAKQADKRSLELPEQCLFIAFDRNKADYLLVISLNRRDSIDELKYRCEQFNWSKDIYGIHCDSNRQQLFIAQDHAVTVTDLCGRIVRVVTSDLFGWPVGKISGISCNGDKVFVLVLGSRNQKVHSFSKNSGNLESSLDLKGHFDGDLRKICLQESKIWLADWKYPKVYKVCGISGKLIETIDCIESCVGDIKKTKFSPIHICTDDRGLLFASLMSANSVEIFVGDSVIIKFLVDFNIEGEENDDCFDRPADMIIFNDETKNCKKLIVCDYANERLCIFLLST
ncbi:hypothetical protein BOX15_Mlig018798g2, partial [Macrostomum lignano]